MSIKKILITSVATCLALLTISEFNPIQSINLIGVSASSSKRISVHAAGRGNPLINLSDGRDLATTFTKNAGLDMARPLALAAGDFDEDGVLAMEEADQRHWSSSRRKERCWVGRKLYLCLQKQRLWHWAGWIRITRYDHKHL
jgi:hypothetical protein